MKDAYQQMMWEKRHNYWGSQPLYPKNPMEGVSKLPFTDYGLVEKPPVKCHHKKKILYDGHALVRVKVVICEKCGYKYHMEALTKKWQLISERM